MQIGILGATGPAGSALAMRLASLGDDVIVGSRSLERGQEVAADLKGRWPDRELRIQGADNEGAAGAEIVVVATPWDGAAPTVAALAAHLEGKVVICMANALTRVGKEFQPLIPPRGSIAEHVKAAAPGAMVAAALQHVPAKELGELDDPVRCDVLVCADDPAATQATVDLIGRIPGVRAIDAGTLSSAAAIEAFTAVLLQVNVRYKTRAAVQFSGIDLP
jgi:NADPH-dependent F420 reductase